MNEMELDENASPPPNMSIVEKNIPLLYSDGKNVPFNLRILMTHFPIIVRIPPLEWLNQTIMSIYVSKIISDNILESLKTTSLQIIDIEKKFSRQKKQQVWTVLNYLRTENIIVTDKDGNIMLR